MTIHIGTPMSGLEPNPSSQDAYDEYLKFKQRTDAAELASDKLAAFDERARIAGIPKADTPERKKLEAKREKLYKVYHLAKKALIDYQMQAAEALLLHKNQGSEEGMKARELKYQALKDENRKLVRAKQHVQTAYSYLTGAARAMGIQLYRTDGTPE